MPHGGARRLNLPLKYAEDRHRQHTIEIHTSPYGLDLHNAPTLLDKGTRLFDHISQGSVTLESNEVIEGTGIIHVKYAVIK
ncbi:hypothetical protein [Paenibacillus sp. GCM10028914]|uniref:hypothetical protein n=1 Tax=Paenibacillus sp. GCM10028914 TaxID=3273416 RepID=UPI003618286A